MFSRLLHLDPKLEQLNSIAALLETLKMSFKNSINWEGELGEDNIRNLGHLAKYEVEFKDSIGRYAKEGKIKPAAIFWPTPDNPKQPSSRFDTLPYINKYPLLDKNTPIGSAGSCFAQEIAKVFQLEGYNYIITERNDDPAKGMVVDNYEYGDELPIPTQKPY
jgi:hypothetical protein